MNNKKARLFGMGIFIIGIGIEIPNWFSTGHSDWVGGMLLGICIGMLFFSNFEKKVQK